MTKRMEERMGVTIVEPSFELYKPKPSQEVYKSIMDADDICQGREPDNEQRHAWAMEGQQKGKMLGGKMP